MKKIIVALSMVFTTAAYAEMPYYPEMHFESTKTRAEVKAELEEFKKNWDCSMVEINFTECQPRDAAKEEAAHQQHKAWIKAKIAQLKAWLKKYMPAMPTQDEPSIGA